MGIDVIVYGRRMLHHCLFTRRLCMCCVTHTSLFGHIKHSALFDHSICTFSCLFVSWLATPVSSECRKEKTLNMSRYYHVDPMLQAARQRQQQRRLKRSLRQRRNLSRSGWSENSTWVFYFGGKCFICIERTYAKNSFSWLKPIQIPGVLGEWAGSEQHAYVNS